MSFLGIVTLVLLALIILSLLFVFVKAFILLLPVALIAIAIIWLIGFTERKNKNNMPSSGNYYDWFKNVNSTQSQSRPRKQAKNVTTKDIDK